ncbi:hypothetical protein V6Z11_A08G225200 [Gossypium hirsutum]
MANGADDGQILPTEASTMKICMGCVWRVYEGCVLAYGGDVLEAAEMLEVVRRWRLGAAVLRKP